MAFLVAAIFPLLAIAIVPVRAEHIPDAPPVPAQNSAARP